MLNFIIVVFSIVEKVNRVKRQYLTLLCVNVCWWLLCWLNGNNLVCCRIYRERAPCNQDHYSLLGKNTFILLLKCVFLCLTERSWRNGKIIKLKVISSLFVEIFSRICSLFRVLGAGYVELRFRRYVSSYQTRWWEKYLSKRSFIKNTFSWRVNSLFVVAGIHSTANLANLKPNKVFFYNLADTLCSFEEPLQVKYLKHHAFISMCYIFTWFNPQINKSTISLGTHPLLSDWANATFRIKNLVVL